MFFLSDTWVPEDNHAEGTTNKVPRSSLKLLSYHTLKVNDLSTHQVMAVELDPDMSFSDNMGFQWCQYPFVSYRMLHNDQPSHYIGPTISCVFNRA